MALGGQDGGAKSRDDERRRRLADEALSRVKRDAETIGGSTLAQAPELADAQSDPIEIWGRRIGRGLGFIAVLAILYHLFLTYVFASFH